MIFYKDSVVLYFKFFTNDCSTKTIIFLKKIFDITAKHILILQLKSPVWQ
jgi:hypothetical protein